MANTYSLNMEMKKLYKLCSALRWILLLFLFVQIAGSIASWFIPVPISLGFITIHFGIEGEPSYPIQDLGLTLQLIGMSLSLCGPILLVYGVHHLRHTLKQIQAGAIFHEISIRNLRIFARATFCSIFFFKLEAPLRALIFNAFVSDKKFHHNFEFTSNELILMLVCGLFYLIVGLMREGQRLDLENQEFI